MNNSIPENAKEKVGACDDAITSLIALAKNNLLPCPFCGSAGKMTLDAEIQKYFVQCTATSEYGGCDFAVVAGPFNTPGEAGAGWNRRVFFDKDDRIVVAYGPNDTFVARASFASTEGGAK